MSLLRTLVHVPRPRNGWFSSSALGDKCLICVGASLLCPEYKMMRYQSGSCRLLSMTQWLVVDNAIVRKHWRTSYQHSAHRSPLSLRHVAHTVREEFGTVVVCTDDTGVSIINVISHSETTQMLHCFTRVALKLALLWLIYQMWQHPVYNMWAKHYFDSVGRKGHGLSYELVLCAVIVLSQTWVLPLI